MARRLRIRLTIDPARARIWHQRLAAALRDRGHDVAISLQAGGPTPPAAISLLLMLERLVYRGSDRSASAAWSIDAPSAPSDREADLVIDLTSGDLAATSVRTLRPVYAGALVEEAATSELLAGRVPSVGVLDTSAGNKAPRIYRAAVERPRVLCKSLDNICARLVTIFVTSVEEVGEGKIVAGQDNATILSGTEWRRMGGLAAVTARARAALTSLSASAPHWFAGWRFANGDRLSETMRLPAQGWKRLPDDGARFYADPFVFRKDGRNWLFLEEFQYASGKALISVVEIDATGPVGTPRPIVERPYHLSYPAVFEHNGEILMMPEMSSAKRVEVLRATQFPDKWESAGVLIEGEEISDATIVEHGNKYWMFGTVGGGDASSWDALHLWHAPALKGPWQPHARNPVLIDAESARPAGAFYRRGGELWRPAQDCTRGYGSGLALARVTQLDEESYSQSVEAVFYPSTVWPGGGFHTLNWAGGVEVVDGCTLRGKD